MLKYATVFWLLVYMGVKRTAKVFESRVLRRIFGPKRDEITGNWRKVHSGGFMVQPAHQILSG
jgi:hypothetical protein